MAVCEPIKNNFLSRIRSRRRRRKSKDEVFQGKSEDQTR
jgi:hypothetical protein